MRRMPIDPGQWLGNNAAAQALLAPLFAGSTSEICFVLFLDADHRALRLCTIDAVGTGSIDLSLRQIIAEAIASDARALILAHNHPDGDPTPSVADKSATRRLAETAGAVNLRLLDHLIFAEDRSVSFRALGLL